MYTVPAANGSVIGFILPPKTGTRSVEQWLKTIPGHRRIRGRHGVCFNASGNVDKVYATVRNPFDVLVSWWYYKGYSTSFSNYLSSVICGRVNPYLIGSTLPYAGMADDVIRFEHGLEQALKAVAEEHGLPEPKLPHIGAAVGRGHYRNYYSDLDRRMVESTYRADFARFQYVW